MNEKQRLRKELLAARKAMPPEEKAWRDAAIRKHLLDWLDKMTKRNLVITFGGGVNEVMRDMIATAGLGLPRAKR